MTCSRVGDGKASGSQEQTSGNEGTCTSLWATGGAARFRTAGKPNRSDEETAGLHQPVRASFQSLSTQQPVSLGIWVPAQS